MMDCRADMKPPEFAKRRDWAPLYFFLIAVAYKVPWTAISSLLGQFMVQFAEPKVLLYLNIAYFLPSIPSLLIHSSIQDRLERSLGVPRAALIRFFIGLGGLALLCLCLPLLCSSLPLLLAGTAAVGVCYSIAFGTSYQLAPRFPPGCTVALTTGFVSCGLVVLAADLLLKRGPYYTAAGMARMFQMMAVQTCIGLLASAAMLRHHARRLAAAGPGSRLVRSSHCPDSADCHRSSSSSGVTSSGRQVLGGPAARLGGRTWAGGLGLRHAAGTATLHPTFAFEHHQQSAARSSGDDAAGTAGGAGACNGSGSASALAISVGGSSGGPAVPLELQPGGSLAAAHAPAAPAVDWGHAQQPLHSQPPQSFHSSSSSGAGGGGSSASRSRLLSRLAWLLRGAAARAAAAAGPLLPLLQLGLLIWPAWTGLLLSVGSSMLAFPFFTFTPHHGSMGEHLPQVLFYSRLLGDILGRLVPPALQLNSSRGVLVAGSFKAGLLLLLLPALLDPVRVGGDVPLTLLVALNWWLSGFVNTGAYLLAPKLVTAAVAAAADGGASRSDSGSGGPDRGKGSGRQGLLLQGIPASSLRAKAGGLMAFCFQVACFLGLMGALAIQVLLLQGWELPAPAAAAAGGGGGGGVVAAAGPRGAAAAAGDFLARAGLAAAQQQQMAGAQVLGPAVVAGVQAAAASGAGAAAAAAGVPGAGGRAADMMRHSRT